MEVASLAVILVQYPMWSLLSSLKQTAKSDSWNLHTPGFPEEEA